MNTHEQQSDRALFGFWLYILSDCVLFAGLFATFAVLRGATFGGPTQEELLNLPYVLAETLLLLASSFAMGMALVMAQKNSAKAVLVALGCALFLGWAFLGLEAHEFAGLIAAGTGPGKSAFMSAFFALVGVHGLHVAIGSLWILTMMGHALLGISEKTSTRLMMLGLFWHFLDIIWICIFTFVYLLGATL